MRHGMMTSSEVAKGLQEVLEHERGEVTEAHAGMSYSEHAEMAINELGDVAEAARSAIAHVRAKKYAAAVFKLAVINSTMGSIAKSLIWAAGEGEEDGQLPVDTRKFDSLWGKAARELGNLQRLLKSARPKFDPSER